MGDPWVPVVTHGDQWSASHHQLMAQWPFRELCLPGFPGGGSESPHWTFVLLVVSGGGQGWGSVFPSCSHQLPRSQPASPGPSCGQTGWDGHRFPPAGSLQPHFISEGKGPVGSWLTRRCTGCPPLWGERMRSAVSAASRAKGVQGPACGGKALSPPEPLWGHLLAQAWAPGLQRGWRLVKGTAWLVWACGSRLPKL